MSALGQKQTFWPFIAMSALPPKADIVQYGGNVQLCATTGLMQRRLDYLVGNREQRHAYVEAAAVTDVDPTAPPSAA